MMEHAAPAAFVFTEQDAQALNSSNPGTKSQERKIIAKLKLGPTTTAGFRQIGIFQISARIHGLRAQGYVINTDRITVVDPDGFSHPRAALYSLISEPLGAE